MVMAVMIVAAIAPVVVEMGKTVPESHVFSDTISIYRKVRYIWNDQAARPFP
jgi:hypothetical protein